MSYSPVPELNLLKAFQDENGFGEYADGFGITDYDDKSGLSAGWSDDPDFLAGLIPFATATGGGSFYALWRLDNRTDLATLPVVVFGDEGGQHVVARTLPELFHLITFDDEPMIDWDGVTFYKAADHEHRPAHADYVTWLSTHFGLPPTDDPDTIVAAAQTEFGPQFTKWADRYLPG